jgi:hypothetical protein
LHRGYIKLYRRVQDNKLWTAEPFTRGQAWIDLIMLANYKDGYIRVRGNRVDIRRGQVGWSQVQLSERWKWSRGKLRRFLDELETDHQIVQQKNFVTSIITIVNYDTYQETVQQTEQQTDSRQNSRRYTKKKDKKDKKDNNTPPTPQKGVSGYSYPDWLNKDLWADFKRMRSRIKKPITTPRTISGLIAKLEKLISEGYSQDEVIQSSIDNCWQSFYPPKESREGWT